MNRLPANPVNLTRLRFAQQASVAQSEEQLLRGVRDGMMARYWPDTFARFQQILDASRVEHAAGAVRPAGGMMGHEQLAVRLGNEDPQVDLFNRMVVFAIQARRLPEMAAAAKADLHLKAAQYADLLSQLPGGVQILVNQYAAAIAQLADGPKVLADQANATLSLMRRGLESALQARREGLESFKH